MKTLRNLVAALALLSGLLLFFVSLGQAQGPITAQAGEDLAITSLTLSAANPAVYEPVTVTIKAKNVGSVSVPGRRIYLYIDPADNPPTGSTPATKEFVVAVTWPPGDSMTVQYANFTFSTPGTHHIYAWVDPNDVFTETNESDNLAHLTVDVAPDPATNPTAYEPDDQCSQAQAIPTDGTSQTRRFESTTDLDWVKFQGTAGQVYTVTATGSGPQADPVFTLWASCNTPPNSFGTTFIQSFQAPTGGDYYILLENDRTSFDPAQSSYRLTVHSTGQPAAASPQIGAVSPATADNNAAVDLVIDGSNFAFPPTVEVCQNSGGSCGTCVQLLKAANFLNTTRLEATVPANLRPGLYCVRVRNPDGQSHTLPNGLTLNATAPLLRQITPVQGFVNLPVELHLYGERLFAPGLTGQVGGVILTGITEVSPGSHLRATIPANQLAAGLYDLSLSYGAGQTAALSDAYQALPAGRQQDLFGQTQQLWLDPAAPRAGEAVEVGLVVHRRGGGNTPLSNVEIEFRINDQAVDTAVISLLSPDSQATTPSVQWTPPAAGDYELKAIIDPAGRLAEVTAANNTIVRTVTVLGQAADNHAPRVNALSIQNAARQVITNTADRLVYFAATASDRQTPSTGVADLRYIEFEYNQGAHIWTPVWDSGWVISNSVNAGFYQRQLTPAGGIHYIQAWARDAAGNISTFPYQQGVNYLPPTERVGFDQARLYRVKLAAGESLQVTITPLSGDPDLYVWPPDYRSEGRPPWVSNLSSGVDAVAFQAPVAGLYQIEVYGYSAAEYQTAISGGSVVTASLQATAGGVDPAKPQIDAPLLPLDSQPTGIITPAGDGDSFLYLPAIMK